MKAISNNPHQFVHLKSPFFNPTSLNGTQFDNWKSLSPANYLATIERLEMRQQVVSAFLMMILAGFRKRK